MRPALHAEWTKVRTEAGTGWLLLATVVLTAVLGAGVTSAVSCASMDCSDDTTKLSLTGIMLGQAVVVILAVLVMGNEYSTGMIRTTLAAMPRRSAVLAAKAAVLTAMVAVAGAAAVLVSLLAGRLILPGNGYTPEHGFAPLSLADEPTLRAAVGSVLYLVLVGLLSLGTVTAVRDSASAIGLVLGLLYLFPIVAHVIPEGDLQRHVEQIAPMTAGLAIQATRELDGLPISPWAGLGVLAAWAAAAFATGIAIFHSRDA